LVLKGAPKKEGKKRREKAIKENKNVRKNGKEEEEGRKTLAKSAVIVIARQLHVFPTRSRHEEVHI
jgi:hypothetical protein